MTDVPTMADAAEMLWIVLANVSGGDWTQQTADWQAAAAQWRDQYFAAVTAERDRAIVALAPAASMLVNSTRAPSSAYVLIITYRLAGEHTPPPRQHIMYGDSAAGLALYLDATIHLYPVVGRIVIQPLEAPTDTTPATETSTP